MVASHRHLMLGAATALFFGLSAFAQVPPSGFAPFPCPRSTGGWSIQWPGPITSASYDITTQLLYVVWNFKNVQAFANVPVGIQQALTYTTNPQQVYTNTILSYPMVMLSEKDNCVIQWEFGVQPYAPIVMR